MAENQAADDAGDSAGNGGGLIGAVLGGVAKVWSALTDDGYLAAAGRQGLGELGMALKAFPDSIQVDEPGTLWNPTQGEIAADRAEGIGPPHPWPSEMLGQSPDQPDSGRGHDTGNDAGYSM